MKNGPGIIWLKVATVYFVIGVSLGLYMGMSRDHTLFSVHAHINLLGWVSLALIGLIYRQFPEIASNRLAQIQFWLHNLGLPCMLLALAGFMRGNVSLEPVIGIFAMMVALSIVLFAVNIFKNLKR
jgi:hypothetical protein